MSSIFEEIWKNEVDSTPESVECSDTEEYLLVWAIWIWEDTIAAFGRAEDQNENQVGIFLADWSS